MTAVLLVSAAPAGAVQFDKSVTGPVTNVTIDWGAPGGPGAPTTSGCVGRGANGDLCDGDPENRGRAPNATGDPDACSGFGWNTGHGKSGGIYSAVRSDGNGPRGPGRPYWAVCVKDAADSSGPNESVAFASVKYSFDLDNYLPPGHVVLDANLTLDYTVDAGDFDEGNSSAILYGFIRDTDTGLFYKIRGDQSAGSAAPGAVDEDLSGWFGCDYLDAWDARVTGELACGVGKSSGEPNYTAKPSVRNESERSRGFTRVCARGAPNLTFGQNFGYGAAPCHDAVSLADFLKSRAPTSRQFELWFRLVVRTHPGPSGVERFALAFDDPLFIKTGSPATPRYGASFAYGATIDLVCQGTTGGTFTFYAQDHNNFKSEFTIATVTDGAGADPLDGRVSTQWDTTPPVNNIDYMTGWWVRCEEGGESAYTKIYLVNPDPEVYLRGRAYLVFLPCVGPDVATAGDAAECQDIKGNGEASTGDHDEDVCENGCDLADEIGKLWITIKMGKRGSCVAPQPANCYSNSRVPVSGSWGNSALAQAAFLGCTSETSCANTDTGNPQSTNLFRFAQENQKGDGWPRCPDTDLDGDGVKETTPSYNGGGCTTSGTYPRDDGRRFIGGTPYYSAEFSGGLSGSDSNTNARVVPKCWSEQPPTNDGNQGSDSHPNWLGGQNDCEFMRGRWSKFIFGASSFRGHGTVSGDAFWWTVGLWLDDRHVFAFGQHTVVGACVPSPDTDHDGRALGFIDLGAHYSCIPDIPTGPNQELESPAASAGVKLWLANSVEGCDSWTSCSTLTDMSDYVFKTVQSWNRFITNLFDDFANFSETYPNDGGPTSITALANHILKIFGEPATPRYVEIGGGRCSTPGVALGPPAPPRGSSSPTNPAGIFYNLLRTTITGNHASNDPFSLGVNALGGCQHASMGDVRPSLRDGAALVLPAASYLVEDRRDMWFLRLNNNTIRTALEGLFQNITLKYAKAIGPANGSSGLNYLFQGLTRADPKAWSDMLTISFENSRDSKFFGGVLLNEQMARAFNPEKMTDPTCYENANGPNGYPNPGCNWGPGVNAAANNESAVKFLTTVFDLVSQGLDQYNLYLEQMNDKNPATVKANAEAKWGFTYWFLKLANTYFAHIPQDKFNASREENTRWVAINNYGNPGNVDYLGVPRGPPGGCGNWVYDRSAHTDGADSNGDGVPGDDPDDNDLHGHDRTAPTNNAGHPMQYREDIQIVFISVEAGNPVKQDAGYGSLDSGLNYLLCRAKYVPDEIYKNLADSLLRTIGGLYKSYYAGTRYGQNAIPATGEEPTVSDVSTQLIDFAANYIDYYRIRPTRYLYDDALFAETRDEMGYSGNNDHFFDNVQQVIINGQPMGRFSCNDGAASVKRCRDRYFYEKAGYNIYLYEILLKILENIDFGPTGAFHNLTKLRVERAADLAGDPQGVQNGLTYALNYGRNLDPEVRKKFARIVTEWIPLYIQSRFDAADREAQLLPGELRLRNQERQIKLQTFAARWFGDWGDLMFSLRGLKAEYFAWSGAAPPADPFPEPFYVLRTDDTLNWSWGTGSPDPVVPADGFSARWSGKVELLAARDVRFQVCGDDGVNFTLDGQRVVTAWANQPFTCYNYSTSLGAGLHDILVEYYEDTGSARVELRWNVTGSNPTCRVDGGVAACPTIPQERLHPPYPYDYAFKAAGALRWVFALLNTIYESFSDQQLKTITRTLAENASRYFGDADGCTGQAANIHVQIGRRNSKCSNPPLAQGVSASTIREQHEVTSRALSALFKMAGLALERLPEALPDLSATTDEGIVFLEHATDLGKRVLGDINALPETQRNITYDRYWASQMWGLRSFQYFVDVAGAGVTAGGLKISATQGQIGIAGADLAKNLDRILGDPQARSGLNYLMTSLRAQDESRLKKFTSNLLDALNAYVRFNADRAVRFPMVLVPNWNSGHSIQEYSELTLFQRANGTLGLKYLTDPLNEVQGLWGEYYDFSNLRGTLSVASDDGVECRLTTSSGSSLVVSALTDVHDLFTDFDATITDRWDYTRDVSSSIGTGPVLLTCKVRNDGGNAGSGGFDAALKVGSRFRIQRSDDDANHHPTLQWWSTQIPGCVNNASAKDGSYCYTRDLACAQNEVWRYATSQPVWWPTLPSDHIGSGGISLNDVDTTGSAASAPFASTGETWGCTNAIPASTGDVFWVWKRIEIDPFEEGELRLFRSDPEVDFTWTGSPDPKWLDSDNFAVRWTGKVDVPATHPTNDWRFQVCSNDGVRLYIDGVRVIDDWVDHSSENCHTADLRVDPGLHDIKLEYYDKSGAASVKLDWNLTLQCTGAGTCQTIANKYLYTRDPAQYNRSARTLFGIVYGWAGALNTLYTLASKAALENIFDTMATFFPEYWGSFGGVFGRSYNIRHEALNTSATMNRLRDDYALGTLSFYRNLVKFAGKIGEQAQFALPNASTEGFLRMWDFVLPSSLTATEKDDLCRLATSGLSGSARRLYYFGEDGYPEAWTRKEFRIDVGTNYLQAGGCSAGPFTNVTNATALRDYMRNSSSGSVIVMLKDICPDTVCDTPLPNAVVYHDTNYPTSWLSTTHAQRIADFFNQTGAANPSSDPRNPPGASCANQSGPSAPCGRSFVRFNATRLADWMQNLIALDRARGSVVVFSQDVCPDTVCENRTKDSTISRYLAAGGRVVWPGDIPLYYQGLSGGGTVTWNTDGQEKILGVDCLDANGTSTSDCFPSGATVVPVSPRFGDRGLTQTWNSVRPVSYRIEQVPFAARYWDNELFSGPPAVVRNETVLDFWFWRNCNQAITDCDPSYMANKQGVSSPDRTIAEDTFSSEWTGRFYQPVAGTVTFISDGDDSRAVVVDGTEVTDANNIYPTAGSCPGDTSRRTGSIALSPGFHAVIYRQCEATGNAGAELRVEGPGWPGRTGLKAVEPRTEMNVLAHHGGVGTLITNISAFHKNFNPVVPDSGFVRVWDCQPGATCGWDITGGPTDPRLRDLWNVSTYNLTLEVHGGQLATGGTGGAGFRVPDINVAGNDSLLLDYMRRGGRVVWVGYVPLYYQGRANGNRTVWDYGGEKRVLGVRTAEPIESGTCGAVTGQCTTRSWEGASKHGLAPDASVSTDATRRPAYIRDVTFTYRKDSKDNASWWMKDFNDSIVSYKRRTTELRTNFLDGFTRLLKSIENVGDWEKKLSTYWSDRYWIQRGSIASYQAWLRQRDTLRLLGSDIVNASVTLLGQNENQGLSYIWRAELDVDWTAGRGPWGEKLLDYANQYFGLQAKIMWDPSEGQTGLGINTSIRKAELSLGRMDPGSTGTWTGVAQP